MAVALQKGTNAPLTGSPVRIEVRSAAPLDLAALLVTASGTVRSDADFVFYNQPQAPGVRLTASGIEVDPAGVPPEIERVVITVSLDGEPGTPATFGAVGPVGAAVTSGGVDEVTFQADALGAETALMLVELYRRQGAWKVRALGQGWDSGLAGIATDFGISVGEEPEPPPAPPPPPPSAPPPNLQKLSLDQGKVSLDKGQTVSLTKTGAAPLSTIAMALGWDPMLKGGSIDLDASCIVLGAQGKKLDTVWFMGTKAFKGAIKHSGDNLTGAGDGDDETIEVDLARLPGEVEALVFTVNSFAGHKFDAVKNAFCRLVDRADGHELVRFDLGASEARTGVMMCVVHRRGGAWEMTALGEFHDAKTVRGMVKPAQQLWLRRPGGLV